MKKKQFYVFFGGNIAGIFPKDIWFTNIGMKDDGAIQTPEMRCLTVFTSANSTKISLHVCFSNPSFATNDEMRHS